MVSVCQHLMQLPFYTHVLINLLMKFIENNLRCRNTKLTDSRFPTTSSPSYLCNCHFCCRHIITTIIIMNAGSCSNGYIKYFAVVNPKFFILPVNTGCQLHHHIFVARLLHCCTKLHAFTFLT